MTYKPSLGIALAGACLILSGCGAPSSTPTPLPDSPAAQSAQSQEDSPVLIIPTSTPAVEAFTYVSQSGDTLVHISLRFGVPQEDIVVVSGEVDDPASVISPGTLLQFSYTPINDSPADLLLPDGEMVYSASANDFDTAAYLDSQAGYLKDYESKDLNSMPQLAGRLVERIALENSVNPRLLLALLEYRCGCVRGPLKEEIAPEYLAGIDDWRFHGLYRQTLWLVTHLNAGYYGWRAGSLTEIAFLDGESLPLAPNLNAGTAALQNLFAQFGGEADWRAALDPDTGFPALYQDMFGDPWERTIEPLYPPNLAQPEMILPFFPGRTWAYTGGPHTAWEKIGPEAAIDFAPSLEIGGCEESDEWVVSMAPGLIVRAETGLLIVDLDGDGNEHTGWTILYLHVAYNPKYKVGAWVNLEDLLGHPSCKGGRTTGTHLHIARRFNGEWILAGGPLPFIMGEWTAGDLPEFYKGTLFNGERTITSCTCATADTYIKRPRE